MTLTSGTSKTSADGWLSEPSPERSIVDRGSPRADLEAATAFIRANALADAPVGPVGIEIEGHVHHRGDPQRPLSFARLDALAAELTPLPHGGRVTLEPGGQVEVSSACHPDAATAIAVTRAEAALVADRLANLGLTWTFRGTDPWREPHRINPCDRYVGMEEWFDRCADGGVPGRTMMCATAALQINLEAGRPHEWADRVRRVVALGPMLTALSGSSRWLAGRDTGLHSARQHAWSTMDPRIGGPLVLGEDPLDAWTDRVLAAPVLHLESHGGLRATNRSRSLTEWLLDPADWPVPTIEDVRRHLTTQFPSVRLRGFLEVRCLDALPEPWWPALVNAVVVWMDDPAAYDAVDVAVAPVADRWAPAYEVGLADAPLRRAAIACLEAAEDLATVTGPDRDAVSHLLALAREGRTPGDLLPAPTGREAR